MTKKAMVVAVAVVMLLPTLSCRGPKSFASIEPALRNGTDFTLLSIDPDLLRETKGKKLHNFPILGSLKIDDNSTRKKIVDALKAATQEDNLAAKGCFNPRHAIVLNYDGHKYEVLICFECSRVLGYIDGEKDIDLLIGHSAQETLTKILTDAGIPVAGPTQ